MPRSTPRAYTCVAPRSLPRATAQVALQDFTTARGLLVQLLKIEPKNAAARKLYDVCKKQNEASKAAERRTFTGLFSRAQREGPLYTKADIERARMSEKEKTQYVADRAEERRRGVEMLDVKELSRLPEEYQQKELDKMNESMENEHRQHEIPEGLNKESFDRLLQMRTDGVPEHKIQKEIQVRAIRSNPQQSARQSAAISSKHTNLVVSHPISLYLT